MKRQYSPLKRWLAVAVSTMMLIGFITPLSVWAEDATPERGTPEGTPKTILAFTEFDEGVAKQAVPLDTALAGLALPATLTATVETPGMEPDAPSTVTKELAVTWQSTPEYAQNSTGDYVFTPSLQSIEGYTLGASVAMPTITVTVGPMDIQPLSSTEVIYVDEHGETQQKPATEVTVITPNTSLPITLNNGWYLLTGEATIDKAIYVLGNDVHLILADGANWNIQQTNAAGISCDYDGTHLNIYAQSLLGNMGKITAYGNNLYPGIRCEGGKKLTINGGVITATGDDTSAGIGGRVGNSGGTIIINGGTVIATGGGYGAGIGGGHTGVGRSVTINGGVVTATGGEGAPGIGGGFENGSVTINGGVVTATGGTGSADIGSDFLVNNGGTLSVSGGATVVYKNNGTNAKNPDNTSLPPKYINCTIILPDGTKTLYDTQGEAKTVVVVNSITVDSKTYDGTTEATVSTLNTAPTLNIGDYSVAFASSEAGSNKPVVITLLNSAYTFLEGTTPVNVLTLATTAMVGAAPAFVTQPTNQTKTAGQDASFTVAVSGYPAPTLQWQVSTSGGSGWNDISGATSGTLILTEVTLAMSGNKYRCLATNSLQSDVASQEAILTVNPQVFSIGLSVGPVAGGSLIGAGSFVANTSNTVQAIPATGYEFVNWTENGAVVSTSASYTFVLTGNITLVAHFKEKTASSSSSSISSSSQPVSSSSSISSSSRPISSSSSISSSSRPVSSSSSMSSSSQPASSSSSTTSSSPQNNGGGVAISSSFSRPASSKPVARSSSVSSVVSSGSSKVVSSKQASSSGFVKLPDNTFTPEQMKNNPPVPAVGEEFSILALKGGLTWDETMLKGSYDEATGTYTFTVLQAGETTLTYTDEQGNTTQLTLTLEDAQIPLVKPEQNSGISWVVVVFIALAAGACVVVVVLVRRGKNAS